MPLRPARTLPWTQTRIYTWLLVTLFAAAVGGSCGGPQAAKPLSQTESAGMRDIRKGTLLYQQGCYKLAQHHFFKAHERFSAIDHQAGVAISLDSLGSAYRAAANYPRAIAFFDEAATAFADLKDRQGQFQALVNKAAALIDNEELQAAASVLVQAEQIDDGRPSLWPSLLTSRGILYMRQGKLRMAETNLRAALELIPPTQDGQLAAAQFALGNLLLQQAQPHEAAEHLQAALAADRRAGFRQGMADDLAALALAWHHAGDQAQACSLFKRSIKMYGLLGQQDKIGQVSQEWEQMAPNACGDLGLTRQFIQAWLSGDTLHDPCE